MLRSPAPSQRWTPRSTRTESEAPLEPGRSGAVRVMNLHKAKGLEANVVILATPFGDWSPPPTARVVRAATGRALGYASR
jgi:hypothetical protein